MSRTCGTTGKSKTSYKKATAADLAAGVFCQKDEYFVNFLAVNRKICARIQPWDDAFAQRYQRRKTR